ncbi:unnamed protein product [Bursaphelenchus xylophilus]|uniref:(pine wood nematode) hypothetical protein n=1 Tax=Bursaphelenchus xylophilus TaxID=6326 RepID=A0A1I7SEG1_BURXY|nr:unnamed protein product [Bursaphelenchus xylophilus]CAG9103962.1 unnamed protein product [Bursaphelenchus xylophilus]
MNSFEENTEGGSKGTVCNPTTGFASMLQSRILGEQMADLPASSNNNIHQHHGQEHSTDSRTTNIRSDNNTESNGRFDGEAGLLTGTSKNSMKTEQCEDSCRFEKGSRSDLRNFNMNQADQSSQDEPDDNASLGGSASPKSSSRSSSRASPSLNQHRVQFKTQDQVDDRRLRRQIANCNERRRMQSINAGFQALRQFLPQKGGDKMSKAAILQQTADLILTLRAEKEELASQLHGSLNPAPPSDPSVSCRTTPKKRRIDVEEMEGKDDVSVYLKTIEDLKAALNREQQLRILYEKEIIDTRRNASTSTPLGLDSSLLNISELLRKNEALQSPCTRQQERSPLSIATLSPNRELGSPVQHPPNLGGNLSPLLNVRKAVFNSTLLQRPGALQNTCLQDTTEHSNQNPVNANSLLASQQSLLNPAFLTSALLNTAQPDIQRSMNLSLAFSNPQQRAATTTVQTSVNNSVEASLLADNRNLNALFEAIRQLENANLNAQIPVQQRLAPSGGFAPPNTAASSQNGQVPTDLLVR